MSVRCAWFRLTLHPSPWPSETGGVELVGDDTEIDESASLVGEVSQIVQRSDLVRAASPRFYVRGNRTMSLEWEEVRRNILPPLSTTIALDALATMPSTTGWLLLEVPAAERDWVIAPAAVESAGWTYDPRTRLLRLRWRIPCGIPSEIVVDAPDYAITTATGFAIAAADGDHLVTAAAP